MTESRKPRHIRDIAHLYLSRLQSPPSSPRATLLVTGGGRGCFSGFHTANLAAAFAAKRLNTSLFELSGLLPNTGYFLALPPQRYIQWNADDNERAIPAMAGIKMCFSPRVQLGFGRQAGRPRMDLFHLPPVFPEQPFRSMLEGVRGRMDQHAVVLLFGTADDAGAPDFLKSALGHSLDCPIYCVSLDSGTSFSADGDRRVIDLGYLGLWERRLCDRIPIVMRVPESALARTYDSLCDTILFRINQSLRRAGASHAGGIS
jgi:hypothetical protein